MGELRLDHIVYAAPELDVARNDLEKRLGVRASPGGRHPGLGTRNFLLALSDGAYLELIGPDLESPAPGRERPFGIDTLDVGRVVTWAVRAPDLDALVASARAAGYDAGRVVPLRRTTPSGQELEWRLTLRASPGGDGLVPFLIDWGGSPHPAATSARGCSLVELRGEHPDPERVRRELAILGAELCVTQAPAVALIVDLDTPNGRVELR